MYTCPTDDIHSIYLDNELPFEYVAQYQEHIKNCPACQKKIENLKKVSSIFKNDSKNINLGEPFLTESFNRLETKLRYSKNTDFSKEKPHYVSKIVPFVAAAAVFVAVILPVKSFNQNKNEQFAKIQPIERPQYTQISSQNVVMNGNLHENLSQNVSLSPSQDLKDIEVFRPDFDSPKNVPFQIKFPDMMNAQKNSMNAMDIKLPKPSFPGHFREQN